MFTRLLLGSALALVALLPEPAEASGYGAQQVVVQRQRIVERQGLLGRFRQNRDQRVRVERVRVEQVYAAPLVQKQFVQKQFVQQQVYAQPLAVEAYVQPAPVVVQKVIQPPPIVVQQQIQPPAVVLRQEYQPSCSLNSCSAGQVQQLQEYNTVLPQCY